MTIHKYLKIAAWLLVCGQCAIGASALGAAATTLDELLQKVKSSRTAEAAENTARENEFRADRGKQQQLLADAERAFKAAEAESTRLSAEFDQNEQTINERNELLKQRSGNLGELFGVTRQVAADTANVFEQSIISAQYPDREPFLRSLADAKSLPSIAELERLWVEMQTELTETAKISRFTLPIVQPDGKAQSKEVVRVGAFNASSGDQFLSYLPSLKSYAVLARQPGSTFRNGAEDLFEAREGIVRTVGDPGRGVLIALYGERPSFMERIHLGGLVGYIIIAVGLVGAAVWVFQFLYLVMARIGVTRQMKNLDHPSPDNALGRVLLAFKGNKDRIEEEAEVAELRLSEAQLLEIPKLERFQAMLRLAVAAGPLLGLIGTVVGMIITFQSITESGSSDPKLMAAGISQAMIATVLGLGIAIPLLFANAVLVSFSKRIIELLEGQGQGLLAESIEKRRA
jgi:biopolymer transport protein ExbB